MWRRFDRQKHEQVVRSGVDRQRKKERADDELEGAEVDGGASWGRIPRSIAQTTR